MKHSLWTFLFFVATFSCNSEKERKEKEIILSGHREAPLGWVYLTIYDDTSFVFTISGLRDVTNFPGKASIINDTIYFDYRDSIPKAGKVAVLNEYNVTYIAGEYTENIGVTLNKIKTVHNNMESN